MASTSKVWSPAFTVVTFPSCDGVWLSTLTPVTMSMPRFLKMRVTRRTMSPSHSARMPSSASSMVTLEPRSASSEANSHPITPPPITATDAGSSLRSRNSSEVMTQRPSTSKPRQDVGHRPGGQHDVAPDQHSAGVLAVEHLHLVVGLAASRSR